MTEIFDSSSRSSFDWMTILLSGLMAAFGISILAIAVFYWWNTPQGEGIEVLVTATGAFGTLVLAAATFFSVRYSIKNNSQMEREREKPIVKDEIAKVIQPAIDALESNTERQSEHTVDWVYPHRLIYNPGGHSDRPSSVFPGPSPVAMTRLYETRPDLWSQLEDHQQFMKTMMSLGETIRDKSETPLRICADELDWELPESEEELNIDLVVSSALKDIDEFGEQTEYFQFWEQHGEDITDLVQSVASDEIKQLRSTETQWDNLCEQLSEDLLEHKVELQQEYGIAESAVDDEMENYPTYI